MRIRMRESLEDGFWYRAHSGFVWDVKRGGISQASQEVYANASRVVSDSKETVFVEKVDTLKTGFKIFQSTLAVFLECS